MKFFRVPLFREIVFFFNFTAGDAKEEEGEVGHAE
jgi:hypothetical protein